MKTTLLFVTLAIAAVAVISAVAADKQADFFAKVQELDPSFVKLKSGALVKVINKGDGTRSPFKQTTCAMHYQGNLPNYDDPLNFDGAKKFDSSYDRGATIDFSPGQVIECWKNYMQMMAPGDKVRIVCPWSIAYGEQGMPQAGIPGRSPLVFLMEMKEVKGKGKEVAKAREMFKMSSGKDFDSL